MPPTRVGSTELAPSILPAGWQPFAFDDAAVPARAATGWLWEGYLARGSVTLLTSQWKTGKTTLLSVLLSRMDGGGRVADREVARCRTVVVTEEAPMHWHRRGERLALGPAASFISRPFAGKPTLNEWHAFVEHLDRQRAEGLLDLVVVDTLASFLPLGAANLADGMLKDLRPLERLTITGTAVLLLHHPRKGSTLAGQAARGTGALSGYCDILCELQLVPGADRQDRRRRIFAWSRHDETPRELVIELTPEGTDYAVTTADLDPAWEHGLETVRDILRIADRPMTREMLLDAWPDAERPSSNRLWRWLDRAAAAGFLIREGIGRRGNAFRYSLPVVDAPTSSPI